MPYPLQPNINDRAPAVPSGLFAKILSGQDVRIDYEVQMDNETDRVNCQKVGFIIVEDDGSYIIESLPPGWYLGLPETRSAAPNHFTMGDAFMIYEPSGAPWGVLYTRDDEFPIYTMEQYLENEREA
ncbi:MAG: hypothetical protein RJB39_670 [Candidatus Parcubacteria bacterium]|jgi:hypothetical protein